MSRFRVGDHVCWSTDSGGARSSWAGKVIEVVPTGALPRTLDHGARRKTKRAHESYIVQVGVRTFWPRASHLILVASGSAAQDLREMLLDMQLQGCNPGVYRRGIQWRAHVNVTGNFWEDDDDPLGALKKAYIAWTDAGAPSGG